MIGPSEQPRTWARLAMVVGLVGLAALAGAGGCAASPGGHSPTGGVNRRAALEARVSELRGQIQDNATQLGLPRASGAGFPGDPPGVDASDPPVVRTSPPPSPSVDPTPMVRGNRCERVCDLAEAICQDADEICRIADELEDDASKDACEDSQQSCKAAQQRCRGCR